MFVGDLAWPTSRCLDIEDIRASCADVRLVANLEGPILFADPFSARVRSSYKFNLYSDPSVIQVAQDLRVSALGLANNHIDDYDGAIHPTIERLLKAGILTFGTSSTLLANVSDDLTPLIVIGACSPITDPHKDSSDCSASIFEPRKLLDLVSKTRINHPAAAIALYVHWGYELSRQPLPADREWARKAIDAGANAVVGHHPHVVQGVERYGDGVIAYSLGNFLLPQTHYRDRRLTYRDTSVCLQLGIIPGPPTKLRWYKYVPSESRVVFLGECLLDEDPRIRALTPYAGMDDVCYRNWFRAGVDSGEISLSWSEPVLWSYFGSRHYDAKAKLLLLDAKQKLRALSIAAGIHKPYNW